MTIGNGARLLAASVVGLTALAGCSAGTAAQPSPGSTTTTTAAASSAAATSSATTSASAAPAGDYPTQLLVWGRELAQCARGHGMSTFPDPSGVEYDLSGIGLPEFPNLGKEDLGRAEELCPDVMRRVPHPPPPGTPSAETLQKMRQYSDCMRQRGAAGFPDPKADGTFPIAGTPFAALAAFAGQRLSDALIRADQYCRRYQVGWYVRAS
jgi:hypothetical protein